MLHMENIQGAAGADLIKLFITTVLTIISSYTTKGRKGNLMNNNQNTRSDEN